LLFIFFLKKSIPLQLISFDFYIKFDPHSFDSYFFILFLIDFFFNFIPKHFVSFYFYVKFGLYSFNSYPFRSFLKLFFFSFHPSKLGWLGIRFRNIFCCGDFSLMSWVWNVNPNWHQSFFNLFLHYFFVILSFNIEFVEDWDSWFFFAFRFTMLSQSHYLDRVSDKFA